MRVRERANEQRAGVAYARRCPVLAHGVPNSLLERKGGGPVTEKLLQLEYSGEAVQPVMRRQGRGYLVLPERVPPGLFELSARHRRVHTCRKDVGLRIGIAEVIRDRG